ncbi:MAG: response regulator transcription factor [Nocardiopsaceae bacterium]|jgi:DNA-binding NarL/FixJ family response regulator|nr:response regulator transcription factor [Nocardiopsaceae bacterium]
MSEPLRVVVADDQDLVRAGLEMLLTTRDCEVVGNAADGRAAVAEVRRTRPDVVLMDIRMPLLDGIAATRMIVAERLPTRVLMLTTYDLDSYVYEALKAGADGFMLKATPPDRLVEGIRTVAAGDALLAPQLTRRLIEQHISGPAPVDGIPAQLSALTGREVEVLQLVARGFTNGDIAGELVISEATVKTHMNHLLARLGLESRVQLVMTAYETGLVRPGGRPITPGQSV